MKKSEKIRIVVFSLVFVSLIIIAMPLAGVGGVNVASATSVDDLPEDYYDETAELLEIDPQDIMGYDSIKAIDKSLNEPIKIPDEITDMVMKRVYIDKGKTRVGTIKISPTDFAVWMGVASAESKLIKPYLVYLDVDGDGRPEQLAAIYNYPYADWVAADEFEPQLEGHFIKARGGYVINPFDTQKELGDVHNLIYIENPDKIQVLPDKTIPWKDAIGKTPAEIGLDKDDRGIFGRTPSQTSSPAQTAPPSGIPTGEENGIPGFEAIFAIVGLLAVAYILRRQNK